MSLFSNKIQRFFVLLTIPIGIFGQTIQEKKLELSGESKGQVYYEKQLDHYNVELGDLKRQLAKRYEEASKLFASEAEEGEYSHLLSQVNDLKEKIKSIESKWKNLSQDEARRAGDSFGFWDQEETSLSQLVMEYGSADFLYIIPQELLSMKLHMHSNIPIPRESWSDLLEIILAQNGVGVRKLNMFSRQLFLMKQDLIAVEAIVSDQEQLKAVPDGSRVVYIFSPPAEQVKTVSYFFERFRDPKRTFVYQVGFKVAIVSMKEEVEKLLSLYSAVWEKESEKVTKVIPLKKMTPHDMERILKSYFGDLSDKHRLAMSRGGDDLSIMTLSHEASLVFVGMKEMVEKAEEIVLETEEQISNPCEMTVYWYTCRHSDPTDICDVLEKVYISLLYSGTDSGESDLLNREYPLYGPDLQLDYPMPPPTYGPPPPPPIVNPPMVTPGKLSDQKKKAATVNFIPYPKTGAIMMVVRRDMLDKLKELVRKLDVPKKMVHIEVLLFEKIIKNKNNFGLNVLKLGSAASGERVTSLDYESKSGTPNKGILEFLISRAKSSAFPAFDIAYTFLMSQEDIRVNALPSVTTVNQVPAKVSIVEEISVNNGAAPIETNSGITFENSFTRNQYGINMVMTPTIHEADPDDVENKRFITLESNVNFDTITSDLNDRPKVNRRSVENQVRVMDGETIILGGLRKKTGEDNTEKIPFLGEIPGIAKLFGTSRLTDEQTEMILFITPQVIEDSKESLQAIRTEELKKRPGDIPEFFEKVLEARKNKKRKLFENSFKLLFGNNDSNFKY